MNRVGITLLLLLLGQLGLFAWLLNQERFESEALESRTLLDVNVHLVDIIKVEDGQGGKAILKLHTGRWVLPELGDLPADSKRVAALLGQLTEVDPGWPVAHTPAARQRYQVAPYLFQRKVTLFNLKRELGSALLGTSPGFRKLHARSADEDAIYSVTLNLFDLPANSEGWLDADLLRVRAPLQITADGYSLDRHSGEWRLGSGGAPDERELQALLRVLRHLRVTGVATAEEAAAADKVEPELILQIVSAGGENSLAFYRVADSQFVHSDKHSRLFRLSAYQLDKLTGVDSFLLSGAQ